MDNTGFDRESAARALGQSMRILEKCIREAETFLEHFLEEARGAIGENWEEVREVVAELKVLIHQEPKSLFREEYHRVGHLVRLVERQTALLGGNPMELVKMANQLASLNGKTVGLQLQIDKAYGGSREERAVDILEELSADQVLRVYQWVEENRSIQQMMQER